MRQKFETAPPVGSAPHTTEVSETVINEVHKVKWTGATGLVWAPACRRKSGHSLEAHPKSAGRYHSTVTRSVVLLPPAGGPQPAPKAGSAGFSFMLRQTRRSRSPKPSGEAGSRWMRSTTETFHMLSCGCERSSVQAWTRVQLVHQQGNFSFHVRQQSCGREKDQILNVRSI